MNERSPIAALLDASVLIPSAPRDTLLRTVEKGLFVPRWSTDILDEVERNLVEHRLATASGAQRLIATLLDVFPMALITGYYPLVAIMTNDPKDRHVLAAAAHAKVDIIVTQNLRHFPDVSLAPFKIRAMSTESFLIQLLNDDPELMLTIVQEQADDLVDPPLTLRISWPL